MHFKSIFPIYLYLLSFLRNNKFSNNFLFISKTIWMITLNSVHLKCGYHYALLRQFGARLDRYYRKRISASDLKTSRDQNSTSEMSIVNDRTRKISTLWMPRMMRISRYDGIYRSARPDGNRRLEALFVPVPPAATAPSSCFSSHK